MTNQSKGPICPCKDCYIEWSEGEISRLRALLVESHSDFVTLEKSYEKALEENGRLRTEIMDMLDERTA